MEVGGTQLSGDSAPDESAFDQYYLHLGPALPETIVESDGRLMGLTMHDHCVTFDVAPYTREQNG
jgi:hypothetical protein